MAPELRSTALVVGAGYVGLVTAVGLAELGHCIHLVETREDRLALLRQGIPPIHEAGLAEALAAAIAAGRLSVSAEPGATWTSRWCVSGRRSARMVRVICPSSTTL